MFVLAFRKTATQATHVLVEAGVVDKIKEELEKYSDRNAYDRTDGLIFNPLSAYGLTENFSLQCLQTIKINDINWCT